MPPSEPTHGAGPAPRHGAGGGCTCAPTAVAANATKSKISNPRPAPRSPALANLCAPAPAVGCTHAGAAFAPTRHAIFSSLMDLLAGMASLALRRSLFSQT